MSKLFKIVLVVALVALVAASPSRRFFEVDAEETEENGPDQKMAVAPLVGGRCNGAPPSAMCGGIKDAKAKKNCFKSAVSDRKRSGCSVSNEEESAASDCSASFEDETDYHGNDLKKVTTKSAVACANACADTAGCKFWSWGSGDDEAANSCWLKTSDAGERKQVGRISGPACRECVVSEWSPFDACSAKCGDGEKRSMRTITSPAVGLSCPHELRRSEKCNLRQCPPRCDEKRLTMNYFPAVFQFEACSGLRTFALDKCREGVNRVVYDAFWDARHARNYNCGDSQYNYRGTTWENVCARIKSSEPGYEYEALGCTRKF